MLSPIADVAELPLFPGARTTRSDLTSRQVSPSSGSQTLEESPETAQPTEVAVPSRFSTRTLGPSPRTVCGLSRFPCRMLEYAHGFSDRSSALPASVYGVRKPDPSCSVTVRRLRSPSSPPGKRLDSERSPTLPLSSRPWLPGSPVRPRMSRAFSVAADNSSCVSRIATGGSRQFFLYLARCHQWHPTILPVSGLLPPVASDDSSCVGSVATGGAERPGSGKRPPSLDGKTGRTTVEKHVPLPRRGRRLFRASKLTPLGAAFARSQPASPSPGIVASSGACRRSDRRSAPGLRTPAAPFRLRGRRSPPPATAGRRTRGRSSGARRSAA